MKTKLNFALMLVLLATVTLFNACKDDDDDNPTTPTPTVAPKLTIELDHLAGNQKFYLDSTYTTANGDQITASMFKYYISNIEFVKTDNSVVTIEDTYYYVDASDENTWFIDFDSLGTGQFKAIRFLIGVDSTRNCSGAQTGALDPANGMFWSWNSGYIFVKLEATSPSIPTNDLTYHIGGYKGAFVNYRQVELEFDGDILNLANNTHRELHLVTDVLELFESPTTINVATFPATIMSPNANASIVADNYANMISYDHIHEE
ncbi:MAG: hypothetical protein JNL49_04355 [Bacteroidia bacterium]|nr:hypothetical protein [Bacteroidia bacterium]